MRGQERERHARYRWTFYIGAAARESAGRRGTSDIEPNASNKANVMELMTGCVPLTLVIRVRAHGFSVYVRFLTPYNIRRICYNAFSHRLLLHRVNKRLRMNRSFISRGFKRRNAGVFGLQAIEREVIFRVYCTSTNIKFSF